MQWYPSSAATQTEEFSTDLTLLPFSLFPAPSPYVFPLFAREDTFIEQDSVIWKS
jgi:hypothetical protein